MLLNTEGGKPVLVHQEWRGETDRQLQRRDTAQLAAPSLMELVSAWDQLALRLPEHAGAEKAAALILNALKLSLAHSNPASGKQGHQLSLASRLADLCAQVCSETCTSFLTEKIGF